MSSAIIHFQLTAIVTVSASSTFSIPTNSSDLGSDGLNTPLILLLIIQLKLKEFFLTFAEIILSSAEFANNAISDESSHLNLQCLPISL